VTAREHLATGAILAPPAPSDLRPLSAPPTFSIVIPAYQAAATIAGAVRSALNQSLPAHEVIVVDDGSTDDLAGALRPFGDRIGVVRKENGGAASARNAGAKAARGEFMAVLDADDGFHPGRVEALSRLAAERPDLDLLTTDSRFVVGGRAVGSFLAANPFETGNQRTAILRSCFVGGWPAVRISRLRELGGFDERLTVGVDWDCWLRMILAGCRAGLVDRPYYDYVLNPQGLTADRRRSLWGRVALLEKATRNPNLRPEERSLLTREIRHRRSEAIREDTRLALEGTEARRDLLRHLTMPGVELRTRLGAVLALSAPPLARRVLHSRGRPDERLSRVGR
jgi:glycosyltransferase involved in cell wall biosynthesis